MYEPVTLGPDESERVAAGWFTDSRGHERYWDGARWSVVRQPTTLLDPAAGAALREPEATRPDLVRSHDISTLSGALGAAAEPSTDPASLMKLASSFHESVRRLVAKNASTPGEVLSSLASDPDLLVRGAALKNSATPIETVLDHIDKPESPVAPLLNPALPIDVLERLAMRQVSMLQGAVFANPSMPVRILEPFADDSYSHCGQSSMSDGGAMSREWVAKNPSATPEILERLAASSYWGFRLAVAEFGKAVPAATLEALSYDPNESVRQGVAKNERATALQLARFAVDESHYVRGEVSRSPRATLAQLLRLASDDTWPIPIWVSENERTPPQLIETLAAVVEQSESKSDFRMWCESAAKNPAAPPHLLARFGSFKRLAVRQAVAGNPSTSEEVLVKLSDDRELWRSIAGNPSTPEALRRRLIAQLLQESSPLGC